MNGRYDGFGFYHGPDDPRLFVPKRIPMMGWTVNLAHPHAPLFLLLLGAIIGGAIMANLLA